MLIQLFVWIFLKNKIKFPLDALSQFCNAHSWLLGELQTPPQFSASGVHCSPHTLISVCVLLSAYNYLLQHRFKCVLLSAYNYSLQHRFKYLPKKGWMFYKPPGKCSLKLLRTVVLLMFWYFTVMFLNIMFFPHSLFCTLRIVFKYEKFCLLPLPQTKSLL